jgi:hypothetical protein
MLNYPEREHQWKYRAAAVNVAARAASDRPNNISQRHVRDLALRALKQLARLDDTIEAILDRVPVRLIEDDERPMFFRSAAVESKEEPNEVEADEPGPVEQVVRTGNGQGAEVSHA